MFAVHEVAIEARFDDAVAQLTELMCRDALRGPSEAAYEKGIAVVVRVGPFGGVLGLSKLVRVRLLEPTRRGATLTIPLRWEATGPAGELFPVLDADLILAADGEDHARLALVGAYRPPFGHVGAALDTAVMHNIAMTTIACLLKDTAAALTRPPAQMEAAISSTAAQAASQAS